MTRSPQSAAPARSTWCGGRFLRSLVVLALLGGLASGTAPAAEPPAGAARRDVQAAGRRLPTHRLIVKYQDSLEACAHCLFAKGRRFQSATRDRSDSLDQLHHALKVRRIKPFFQPEPEPDSPGAEPRSRAQRTQDYQAWVAQTKARHPERHAPPEAEPPDLSAIYLLELEEDVDAGAAAARYQQDPHVVYAYPDYHPIHAAFVPGDYYYSRSGAWGQAYRDLWPLQKLNLEAAWDVTKGRYTSGPSMGKPVIVAVVDTGLDFTHPDISANLWVNPEEDLPQGGLKNGLIDGTYMARCPAPVGTCSNNTCVSSGGTCVTGTTCYNGICTPATTTTCVRGTCTGGSSPLCTNGLSPDVCPLCVPNGDFDCRDTDGNGKIDDLLGFDFTNVADGQYTNGPNPFDDNGHGTHVAGLIAAANNTLGIVGVAPEAQLMSLKALNNAGETLTSVPLAEAILYAASQGARVINNSWASACPTASNPLYNPSSDPLLESAIATAMSTGAVVVLAAGNGDCDVAALSPQNMTTPKPIVVAATTYGATLTQEQRSHFAPGRASDFGALIDVAAPGGGHALGSANSFEPDILSLKAKGCAVGPDAPCDANYPERLLTPPDNPPRACSGSGQGTCRLGETCLSGTCTSSYLRLQGTSMATPLVSGVAALLGAARPTWTPEEIRQAIRASADDVEAPGADLLTGTGRINAARALGVNAVARAQITSPSPAAVYNPYQTTTIDIWAIATGASDFQRWDLEWGQGAIPSAWSTTGLVDYPGISHTTAYASPTKLARWDIGTLSLATDAYVLRLTVKTANGTLQFQAPIWLEAAPVSPVPVTTNPAASWDVAGSGNLIVWTDMRSGNEDIYLYDLSAGREQQITNDPAIQRTPSVSGTRIAWADTRRVFEAYPDYANWDIYVCQYDSANRACPEQRITNNLNSPVERSHPIISGTRIVWAESPYDGNWDIYLYDLSTADGIQQITAVPNRQTAPVVSGNRVAWLDSRSGSREIYYCDYNAATRTCPEQRITPPTSPFSFDLSGNLFVWDGPGNFSSDLYLYDLGDSMPVVRQITNNTTNQSAPRVDGRRIVWSDDRASSRGVWDTDIYLCDHDPITRACLERRMTANYSRQESPVVAGNRIAWRDLRNGNWDVYSAVTLLPAPWTDKDIGSVGKTGVAWESAGTFTLKAAGADIGGTADAFHFVYQPWTGNGTIIARVAGVQNTGAQAKAGVMFRQDLSPGSPSALVSVGGTGTVAFKRRTSPGGSTSSSTISLWVPYWVKLKRDGNQFTASISSDGSSWSALSSAVTISMPASVYVGLAVTAGTTATLNTSTFDNVSVSPCHILTAAFGRPDAPEIQTLFALHHVLVPDWDAPWHQRYLAWYDREGPKLAAIIRQRPLLRALIRQLVRPAAALAQRWLHAHGEDEMLALH